MSYPTYSVSGDTASGTVNAAKLHTTIDALAIAGFGGVTVEGDVLTVVHDPEPSAGEKSQVDSAVAAHNGAGVGEKNYLVRSYSGNLLATETWYNTDDGDGTYSGKVETTSYTYSGQKLVSKSVQSYYTDGTAYGTPEVWNYYTDDTNNRKVEKRQS